MKRLRSIRFRLLVLIGMLLLAVLGGFGYVAWRRESSARFAAIDRELDQRLNMLIGGFRPRVGQRLNEVREPQLTPHARELFTNEGGEPFYFQLWLSDGRLQSRSDDAPQLALPQGTGEERSFRTRGDFREVIHFAPSGRCFLVGRSIRTDRAAMRADGIALASTGAGVLLVGLGLAWWIASRVIKPLTEVSRTARQIAAGDLSQRIGPGGPDDEISDVAKVLNEAFARLEDAFARQKQFTADASHELRTPVALILTHAQGALLHEQSPAEYREALADCARAGERMKIIIESLLELARFDAHAEPIRWEPSDLAILAEECVELLRPLAEGKHLELDLDLGAAPCQCEPARIMQVIINLLTNAIHFTPTNGTVTMLTRSGDGASLFIRDTGPGIPSAQISHLFERFHRSDTSRSRATGGNGLGLAICKAIVEAHGGRIEVESEPGKGTSFLVWLP